MPTIVCAAGSARDGHRIARPANPDAGWLAAHLWRWNPGRLDEIIETARRKGVVTLWLCGQAANALDLADRFDVCVLLDIDQRTMAARMASPSWGNDFGQVGGSLQVAVAGHTAFLAAWRRYGAVTVDATGPVATVGHDVLMGAAGALLSIDPERG